MLARAPHVFTVRLLKGSEVERRKLIWVSQPRIMESWCVYLLCTLLCATGSICSHGVIQTEEYSSKYLPYFSTTEDGNEKQLINELHEVLERLQNNQLSGLRKKHGHLPLCDPGDQCALRKGSRIGKLCDCSLPRTCNSFLHRCL